MAAATVLAGFGISLLLPAGWSGHLSAGAVVARTDGAVLRIYETRLDPQLFRARPLRVHAGRTTLWVRRAGRDFDVFATVRAQRVTAANRVLASLAVRAGDFYRGWYAPPRFAPAPGWHTRSSGAAWASPDGFETIAVASTVPYRDPLVELPPHRTLAAGGAVVYVVASRTSRHRDAPGDPRRLPSACGSFEGAPLVTTCHDEVGTPKGAVSVYVFLPRDASRAQARAELRRLRLPRWTGF